MIDLARAGAISDPDGVGEAGGGACDDRVRFTLAVRHGGVTAVRFGADGCPATLAAASWLAERAEGRTLLEAALLSEHATAASGPVAAVSPRCAAVAVDALHAAIGDAFARGAAVPGRTPALIAMSGGVDSAIALAEAPPGSVGATLRLWIDPAGPDGSRACCAPDAVRRARALCHERGHAHLILDLAEAFRTAVVDPFVRGYGNGETPNPCTRCNGDFRLDALVRIADAVGAPEVRTGHYARRTVLDGIPLIARGADGAKDQSYMLAKVAPAVTARLAFPLGDRTKAEIRARAAALGLAAAGVPESQEICFLGGDDYRAFLRREGVHFAPGEIVDPDGQIVGRHGGHAAFTPGQRRGIGVASEEPLYVMRTDAASNSVVVAPRRRLGTRRVALRDVVMHIERDRVDAQLRHRSPPVAATLDGTGPHRTLELDREAFAIAGGQTAAIYLGGAVVGFGTITQEYGAA
jgi:tRNA-uridine 2-sulfurtransferase